MIYHSNTQKPLQGGRSHLGSRGIQGASGGEEAKEWSPEGPRPINCWVFIIVIIVFSDVTKPVMVFGRRWKFQTFVYNWLWGPQPNWKTLASDWIVSEAGYSPGFRFLNSQTRMAAGSAQTRSSASGYPSLHAWGALAWTNGSLCLCLDAELSSWSRCRTLQENRMVSWYFDFKLLEHWNSVFWLEHIFSRIVAGFTHLSKHIPIIQLEHYKYRQ